MNPRTAYQLQILEKVGAPLLAATQARAVKTTPEGVPAHAAGESRSEAAIVAELLARSVQSGLNLAQIMDVREQGADGESVRLALSALGASLVAGLYSVNGEIPQDADMQRQVAALSAALTFADNFSPAAANTGRLQDIEAGRIPGDETQVMIQCLHALAPVVSVIAGYAFGRPEKKMLLEVTERLVQKSTRLATRLLPQAPLSEQKFAELGFLRALATLYCAAHRAETQRMMDLNDAARAQMSQNAPDGLLPLDHLWADFDRHAALLDVLGQSLLPAMMAAGAASAAGGRAPHSQVTENKQEFVNPPPPAARPAAPMPPPAAPASPLSFFKPGSTSTQDSDDNT
ncbi:MAG TPA: hypothetical protein VGD95_03615 [Micavibrio sp.]